MSTLIAEVRIECLQNIEDYYQATFAIEPQKCMPYISLFLKNAEMIATACNKTQAAVFQQYLNKLFAAMQQEDYVLVRDYIYYEIRPWIKSLKFRVKAEEHEFVN